MARAPILETAIMDILWDTGDWLTPREVRSRMPAEHSVAYTTVMTVLVRLLTKGRVERRLAGRAYEYRSVDTREAHAAAQMEDLLAATTNRASTLGHFLGAMTDEERAELRKLLER